MTPYFQTELGVLYQGDVLDVLRQLPDESVQTCVTSPPYWGLRDYKIEPQVWDAQEGCEHEWGDDLKAKQSGGGWAKGDTFDKKKEFDLGEHSQGFFCLHCGAWHGSLGLEPTPELFVQHMVEVFREVKRVLRNDGTAWVNLGSSYAGSGSPGGDFRDGKGGDTYLRPYNRSDCGFKPKDMVPIPWMVAMALQSDGWWLRSDIIWYKPNPMPESVTDRPTKSHEYLFLLSKQAKYYYDAEAIREPLSESTLADSRNATGRHTQGDKHGTKYDEWESEQKPSWYRAKVFVNPMNGRNKRSVWTIATHPFPGSHFAVFPEKLIEPCILAGTSEKGCCPDCGKPWERVVEKGELIGKDRGGNYKGRNIDRLVHTNPGKPGMSYETKTTNWQPTCSCGKEPIPCVVLDIFFGAGTTGLVCEKLNRRWIGIELSEAYCKIAAKRIDNATKQRRLFE